MGTERKKRRIRPLLLVLLWAWAGCVFLVLDLFLTVDEFDEIRPRSPLYRGMRLAAHRMVGEGGGAASLETGATDSAVDRVFTGPSALLAGRVYRTDGTPAAEAVVAARQATAFDVFRTRAGKDGTFRLDVPLEHSYVVAATSPGCLAAVSRKVHPPARVDLVLVNGARLRGRVVDDSGRGVENVVLRLTPNRAEGDPAVSARQAHWLSEGTGTGAATTGSDGAFAFEGLAPGTHRILVADGPVRVGDMESVEVAASGESIVEIRVRRARPVAVAGVVVDRDSGRPLPGALVGLTPGGRVRTDADGRWRVGLVPQGRVGAEVRVSGRVPFRQELEIGSPAEPIDLRVPAGRVVNGQVLGPNGEPRAGALIAWHVWPGTLLDQPADEWGRFRLDPVRRHQVLWLSIRAPGCATTRVPVRPEENAVVVRLAHGAEVRGLVLDPDGRPMPDAVVRLLPSLQIPGANIGRPMDGVEGRAARTDAEGRYRFEGLPEGSAAVVALPADDALAPALVSVETSGRSVTQAPDLRPRAGVSLEGRVADPEDNPVAGALVLVTSAVSSVVALTGADGAFLLGGVSDAFDHEVLVTHYAYEPGRVYRRARDSGRLPVRLRPR